MSVKSEFYQLTSDVKLAWSIFMVCSMSMTMNMRLPGSYPGSGSLRTLSKEERKKVLDEEKAAKLKAKQEAATAKSGSSAGGKR